MTAGKTAFFKTKTMTRTFEIKTVITIPEEMVDEEEFKEFKNSILNGEPQREMKGGKFKITKVTMTINEIKK